jgi:CRISPR-associated protein Cmr4
VNESMMPTVCSGLLGLHALTGVHPGSGTSLGAVDLPIQRERHTYWPTIPGSTLKGILRDVCRERAIRDTETYRDDPDGPPAATTSRRSARDKANDDPLLSEVFGPTPTGSSTASGALSVTDARLLAFPVRSLRGLFAWVTCGSVLERLRRDIALADAKLTVPDIVADEGEALVSSQQSDCLIGGASILLEEFDFRAKRRRDVDEIAEWIVGSLLPSGSAYAATRRRFLSHFVVLHDDDFSHFARYSTDIVARIALRYDTKTVKDGALFHQEFLPPETLLYSVVIANAARRRFGGRPAPEILRFLADRLPCFLQIGSDETTGKGYCAPRLFEVPQLQRSGSVLPQGELR